MYQQPPRGHASYRRLFCEMTQESQARHIEALQQEQVNYRTVAEAEEDQQALGRPTRYHSAFLWGVKIQRMVGKLTPMLVMGHDLDRMNEQGVAGADIGEMISSAFSSVFERREVDIKSIYDIWPGDTSKKRVPPLHPEADDAHFHAQQGRAADTLAQEALERELPLATVRAARVVVACPHCGKQLGVTVYLSPLDDDGSGAV